MSHTPGKLYVDDMLTLSTDSTLMVAECDSAVSRLNWSGSDYATRSHREANARRIVACWNACEGYSTEELGGIAATPQGMRAYSQQTVDALTAQRDSLSAVNAELVAALVEARRWIGDGDMGDGMAREIWTPKYAAAVDMVDAAIASARKQEDSHE